MKLKKKYKIDRAASDDPTRAVHNVLLSDNEKQAVLVATNGRILAVVPVEKQDGDTNGLIPAKAFIELRREFPKKYDQMMSAQVNGAVVLPSGRTFQMGEGTFPKWEMIIPKADSRPFKVKLNPTHLVDLAEAIGSADGVTLSFDPADPQQSIVVNEGAKAFGLLMPMVR